MIYEGLYLGLQYLWNGLRFEVDVLAKEHEAQQAKAAQQDKIDGHEVNRVPQDDEEVAPEEPADDGDTQGVSDEGSSADM